MATPLILVVDDEPSITHLVQSYLEKDGFTVATAADGLNALELAARLQPRLVVLDVMLPGLDGLEVCRRLRQSIPDTYILMLTARSDDIDKIIGLEVGADDYLTKPFNPRELVARVRAILRRERGSMPPAESAPLRFGPLLIDRVQHVVKLDERPVDLTPLEFELLVTLAQRPGMVFSRDRLLEQVWGYDFEGDTRVVDTHIKGLRRKLDDDPVRPRFIQTVRSVGYKFLPREE